MSLGKTEKRSLEVFELAFLSAGGELAWQERIQEVRYKACDDDD